jgi:hypothetical protein
MPLSTEMRKNKSKVRFVESSFGEKVGSTFPVVQYRIVSPYQDIVIVVCLRKTNTNSFILSRAYINKTSNERN